MSGPAYASVHALDALSEAIEKNEAAEKKHEVALKKHADAHEEAGKKEKEHESILKQFSSSLIPEIALGELAAEGIKKLAESFYELGEAAVDFGIEGVKFAIESAEFKENMILAFDVVSRTADEGEKTYAAIEGMAAEHHLDIAKTLAAAKELALTGLENEQILSDSVEAQGALQRAGLDAGAEKLRRLIEQSEAAGHLVLPKKLGGLGFSKDDLAKNLGESVAELDAGLKAMTISADKGIAAIDATILGGNVGKLAAKKFDLTDVATDWHNIWRQLTEDVDAGPLTNALRDFVSQFSEGKPAFGALKDEIVHDVNRIIEVIGDVTNHATLFALKAELSFLLVELAIQPLTNEFERLGGTHDVIHALGSAIKFAADHMLRLAEGTATVLGTLSAVGAVGGHVGGIHTGESFVQGLVTSLYAGIPGVHAAGHDLSAAAHEGAKTGIDAHSPSRKAFGLGEDYGEGYAMGGEASRDRVAAAMGDMAMPDLPPASPAGGNSSSSRTMTVTIEAGAIVVHGAGESAHEMAEITLEQFADVMRRSVQELGG
jgi:hypothetical protein